MFFCIKNSDIKKYICSDFIDLLLTLVSDKKALFLCLQQKLKYPCYFCKVSCVKLIVEKIILVIT